MVRLSKARVLSVADTKMRLIQEMEKEDPTKSIVSLVGLGQTGRGHSGKTWLKKCVDSI
jgi:hypothetical protein